MYEAGRGRRAQPARRPAASAAAPGAGAGAASSPACSAQRSRCGREAARPSRTARFASSALIPAEPAAGNFTRVVQRVPVKIVLDSVSAEGGAAHAAGPSADEALQMGLSARVSVAGS